MGIRTENAKALYLEGIRDGRAREAVTKYTGARYTQHSTGVADGVEGFVAFFEPFIERNPKRHIEIVRALEEGQYVFVHAYQSMNDGESEWVTTDFFDTDDTGKIIEHWDVIAPFAASTPSGRTTVDGASAVSDLGDTQANKARVREMFEQALIPEDGGSKLTEYVAADCISHDAGLPDGVSAFAGQACGPRRLLAYREVVLTVAQGNFVATLSRASLSGKEQAQVDLFRLARGKIVERWSNAEDVPPPEQWGNSGKF